MNMLLLCLMMIVLTVCNFSEAKMKTCSQTCPASTAIGKQRYYRNMTHIFPMFDKKIFSMMDDKRFGVLSKFISGASGQEKMSNGKIMDDKRTLAKFIAGVLGQEKMSIEKIMDDKRLGTLAKFIAGALGQEKMSIEKIMEDKRFGILAKFIAGSLGLEKMSIEKIIDGEWFGILAKFITGALGQENMNIGKIFDNELFRNIATSISGALGKEKISIRKIADLVKEFISSIKRGEGKENIKWVKDKISLFLENVSSKVVKGTKMEAMKIDEDKGPQTMKNYLNKYMGLYKVLSGDYAEIINLVFEKAGELSYGALDEKELNKL